MLLCEPANPPRKVLFCDTCGPAANCLWVIAARVTKPTGQEEKPARTRIVSRTLSPRPRRRLPPSHSSTAPPIFWRAHALPPLSPRPPARHPHSAGRAAQVISAPARRHLRPPRSGVFSSFPKGPRLSQESEGNNLIFLASPRK
ncbi:hypothetical protein GQ55_1G122500 [Panicum hallii var. hallii]|uniref:Uncharacterized protein n=1 Tax=Panicum hallii var. hallii TaxID=1504633 RepID=A0A2T7F4U5_9POAL|nr:hypothetical protein GQ55_1G122500 [Panicum hallii var. hallii]PUZ75107.1 hypothetical protein GQ55_1G122500 [Panicum hallii var. hallii]